MTIAVITTLGDNLIKAKMIPLSRVPDVEEICFVTDAAGPKIDKVRYFIPPGWVYVISLHKSMAKFLVLLYVVMVKKPSIVMAYNVLPHGYSAWFAGKLAGRKIFQHLIGGRSDVVTEPETSDNSLIRMFPAFCRLTTAINLWIIRHSDLVFVPGKVTREAVTREFGIPPTKVVVLHSTIDTERFSPREGERAYDLILVGRLCRRKRVDLFLKCLAIVKKGFPQVQAAIMGEGPAKEHLLSLCCDLQLSDNVHFLGYRKDMENYYNSARIFVLTSAFEGLSCASMEAMACGLPAVVPDVGDMREVAVDEQTGYCVSRYDDPEEYALKISQLLADHEMLRECSVNSAALISREHSFHSAQESWAGILQSLVN